MVAYLTPLSSSLDTGDGCERPADRRAPLRGGFDGRYRQEEAEPVLPRGHAQRDPVRGAAAGPLPVVGGPTGLENRQGGAAESPVAERHARRGPRRTARITRFAIHLWLGARRAPGPFSVVRRG